MRILFAFASLALILATSSAAAQSLDIFRWQLQPYCNVVTLLVTQSGALYTLDGADDQCGAGQLASIVGTAFLNPDGLIGIGLTTVIAPGGAPVHIDARINIGSLSGPWRDSAGNSGTFVFTPGASTGGPLRPVAPNGLAPGSITAAQLAPGIVGGGQINPNQVQTRVGGSCPVGQYLRGINANGTVVCEPLLTPNVSTVVDDPANNNVGRYTSIAIGHDGLPIISHNDNTAGALRVTKCGNTACTVGNVTTTVDDPAGGSVGTYTSIAIGADGLPIISHHDNAAGGMRVTKCGNAACSAGNTSHTVDDPANFVGVYTSIAIGADGLPIISYRDLGAAALRVTKCGDAACSPSATNVSTTVDDPANSVGFYTSIAIGADGLPVISHQDDTAKALRVTKCSNAACTAGASTNISAPAADEGYFSSLAVGVDGLPVISHLDGTAGVLRVTKCGNATCTAGNVVTTVDQPGSVVGFDSSIAIGADGRPIISHRDNTAGLLRVTKCGNAACTAGNVSTIVDDTSGVGGESSIAVGADGLPVISYRDTTAGALRVTKCATTTCQ